MSISELLAYPLMWAVRVYQIAVSPFVVQQCRFYPSCSAYAVTALQRYGAFRGTWLTLRRLARCHPWNPGGVDHVPPRGAQLKPDAEAAAQADAPAETDGDGRPPYPPRRMSENEPGRAPEVAHAVTASGIPRRGSPAAGRSTTTEPTTHHSPQTQGRR